MVLRTLFGLAAVACAAMGSLRGNTLDVPSQYLTIQEAIQAANPGDTVLVAPGVYYENINYRGKGIVVASRFILDHNPTTILSTIINGSTPVSPDSASCVVMARPSSASTGDTSAALVGFTLTGGTGTKWNDEHNSGTLYREGGGILIQYWAPRIQFNYIHNNQATDLSGGMASAGGGAIRCGDGNPAIAHNVIYSNTGRYGAGIVFNYSGATVKNNIISSNSGGEDYGGGGVWTVGNSTNPKILQNNTIVNNTSATGAGIQSFSSTLTVRNNILWANNGVQITRSGGTVTATYNDVQGGYSGIGNINSDPLFDAANYYLTASSPCVDAGDTNAVYEDPEDISNPGFAQWPAMGIRRNDMGAYGGPGSSLLGGLVTAIKTSGRTPDIFNLDQNYPNPFNPSTVIRFELRRSAPVTLEVYNVIGQHVATLVNEFKASGVHQVTFHTEGLASGAYYYRLSAGGSVQTRRMLLIK